MVYPSLPDSSQFHIDLGPGNEPESYEIFGQDEHRFFSAGFEFGFSRATGDREIAFVTEPDVLHISDIDATEGQGLGSLVTSMAIEEANKREICIGRLGIVNGRMISVIERLTELGTIKERYYRLEPPELRAQPLTSAFEYLPGLVDSQTAKQQLETDDNIAVDCVIKF